MKSSSCLHHVVALCALLFGILEHTVFAAPADGLSIFVATGKPPANSLANSISEEELILSGDLSFRLEEFASRSMITEGRDCRGLACENFTWTVSICIISR